MASIAQKFEVLADTVPQLIWENNSLGEAVYFNKRWFEFSGLTYEQSLSVGWVIMGHPDDEAAVTRWGDALAVGEQFEAEVRLRKATGEYIWHLLRNTPMSNDEGQVIGWFGTATDIHQQKQTQAQLLETSVRLRAVLETAIDFAIITLDANGQIVDWNSGAEKMFGYEASEALGRYSDFLFTPEDVQGGIHELELSKAQNTGQAIDERWHMRSDGSRFFMSGVMKPINDRAITGFVKIARDITDRKLAEEALLLSEQHKSLAVESAEMGEWNYNIASDVIECDDKFCYVLQLPTGLRGITMSIILQQIHDGDRELFRQALNRSVSGINIFHTEARIISEKGRADRWINFYGRVVAHENNIPTRMIGVAYDITPRKFLEKQKDDFISVASHELRSPVTSIKSYSELIEDTLVAGGNEENIGLMRKLNQQIDRLVKLIRQLLDASNISVSIRIKPENINLNQVIKDILATLRIGSAQERIIFNEGQLPTLHADPQRIGQVIENLVTNALKYSPEDTKVIVTTEDFLEGVKVSVRDFGPGIPNEYHQAIFERYYRVRDENLSYSQGLGLGLYISSEIIRQHFGTIGVSSNEHQGATFYFLLPYT